MRPVPNCARALLTTLAIVAGCSDDAVTPQNDGGLPRDAAPDAPLTPADAGPAHVDASAPPGPDAALPCATRISYGATWIRPQNHADAFDDVQGLVTWDGVCVDDASNSYALLSNGFKPYFSGRSACVLGLDSAPYCGGPASCATRVTYGAAWAPPPNHPAAYDDVAGRLYSDGVCHPGAYANLSNGWQPHFSGAACPLSFRYEQCGGLYANPVIPGDCPDPGVMRDGSAYVLTCTGGDASSDAYPIYTSSDLISWKPAGHIFPAGKHPTWATGLFWAPEIHKVGKQYVAYFSAQNAGGRLAIGAAFGPTATGPFTDIGKPLIADPAMGLIDVSEFTSSSNVAYVLWKEDGNAQNKPTPIHIQPLAADGLSLTGAPSTLITNDRNWEGNVVEGPWMTERNGLFYLFYSGASYANASYAVGVARGSSPLGPMTKPAGPILTSNAAWTGPGHCSVLDTPAGETVMIYHAWEPGCVNKFGCGRHTMVDRVTWDVSGWPGVPLSPSITTRPRN